MTEFYNIEIGEYCYIGFPGHELGYKEIFEARNFINSEVMLINLKKLREMKDRKLFEKYFNEYETQKVDEYLINVLFYDKIKFLSFIYGIPDFEELHHIIDSTSIFWNSLKGYCNGTEEEMISASENRVIIHMGLIKILNGVQGTMKPYLILGKNGLFMHRKLMYLTKFAININNLKKNMQKYSI